MKTINRFENEHRWLSNFFAGGGARPTAEHQFQARKATTILDAIYVMAAQTAGEAKGRGRSIKCRPDWEDVKLGEMYNVLILKFSIEPVQTKLLDTGDAELIEGNTWNDTYWGVCRGRGENNLGQLLMIVRDHYAEVRGHRQSQDTR